jgi:hypothetical protein
MLNLLLALFVVAWPQAESKPTVACANVWEGQAAKFEEYIQTAKVEKVTDIPIGVTRPKRAYTVPGGLAASFAWKPLKPGFQSGYYESYKSEIAAYELDKLLGMGMVPIVVERRVDNELGAAIIWLQGVRSWEAVQPLPKPPNWGHQVARMKMFDDLIGNSDRNKGNMLIDEDWHMYLIDHSRAFVTDAKLPQELQNVDRRLWDGMLALDEAGLKTSMGKWLDGRQIHALIRRRDGMKKKIDALAAKRGDSIFF